MMRIAPKFQCLTDLKSRFSTVRYNSQLFVSRLSFYTTYDDFRGMFSPFGNIKEAKLVMDNRIGRTKGFGFVTFETEVEAQNAIKALNGKIVQGRLIFVESVTNTKADGNDAPSES
ncbi:Organelle RRM domain-containing protein 6 chloroplastic [Bienertia sinuspersici]